MDPENRKLLDAFGVPAHAEVVVQRSFAEKLSLMWQNVFRIKFRLSLLDRPALVFRLKLGNTGTEYYLGWEAAEELQVVQTFARF